MKRIAVIAMAVAMIVCALALPASAATANGLWGEVPLYKGTITVDGKMDDIYAQALKIQTSKEPYNEKNASEASATLYVLHDSKNLYVLIDVNNVYPITEYNPEYAGDKAWNSTAIEFFLDWTDKAAKSKDTYKYVARLDGEFYGKNLAADNLTGITYKVTVDKAANKYMAEFCFPFVNVASGANIGLHCNLDADKTMGKDTAATRTIAGLIPGAGNDPTPWKSITLSTKEVKLPEVTTTAATTAAETTTAATTKAPETPEASAQTFDAAVVLAVVAAAAGAGVVVSKKRK